MVEFQDILENILKLIEEMTTSQLVRLHPAQLIFEQPK